MAIKLRGGEESVWDGKRVIAYRLRFNGNWRLEKVIDLHTSNLDFAKRTVGPF